MRVHLGVLLGRRFEKTQRWSDMTEGYQCEQCNKWDEDPAQIITAPGYRGKIIIKLCEDCAKEDRRR